MTHRFQNFHQTGHIIRTKNGILAALDLAGCFIKEHLLANSRTHRIHVCGEQNGVSRQGSFEIAIYISGCSIFLGSGIVLADFKSKGGQFLLQPVRHVPLCKTQGINGNQFFKLF